MKKIKLIFFSFFGVLSTHGQDSAVYKLNKYYRIINNTDFDYRRVIKKLNDTTWEQFDYTRLRNPHQRTLFKDKDLKIRNGLYTRFNNGPQVIIKGNYKNNKPEGVWYFYSPKKIDSLNYNFYSDLRSNYVERMGNADSIIFNTETDKAAVFPGGEKAWKRYLNKSFEAVFGPIYPEKEIQISFMIDKDGKVINVYPVKSIDPQIDLEVVQIIRESPKWISAEHKGRKIISIITQSVNFDKMNNGSLNNIF